MADEGDSAAARPSEASKSSTVRNPLWVISIFLGLCEVVAGTVTALTFGLVQIVFTFFVVIFPLLIAGAFFYTLWTDPIVLYAPGDYPEKMEPSSFARAVNRRNQEVMKVATDAALASVEGVANSLLSQHVITEAAWKDVTREGQDRVRESVRRRVVYVDMQAVGASESEEFVVTESTTVSDLLNEIWFRMDEERFPSYTYGETWILENASTGATYDNVGGMFAERMRGVRRDNRSLASVGVHAGDRLRAVAVESRPAYRRMRPGFD